MTHATREDWLTAATEELRPVFDAINCPLPKAIRVACGFPLNAKRSRAIGECWAPSASADATVEILVSPVLDNPTKVFEVLVHELCHATAGAMNHGRAFQSVASRMQLVPTHPGMRDPWRSTVGGADFASSYGALIADLGAYPHGALTFQTRKTQSTRMLKAYCPTCGYTVRLTQKWADVGMPSCPCGDDLTL